MNFDTLEDLFNGFLEENGINIDGKEYDVYDSERPSRTGCITVEKIIDYLIEKKKTSNDMDGVLKILFSPDVGGNGFRFFELDFTCILYSKKLIGQDVLDSPFAGVKKVSDDCIEIIFLNIFTRDSDKESYLIESLYHLGLKYITRDEDGSLYAWQFKPEKQRNFDSDSSYWYFPDNVVGNYYRIYDANLFPSIAWEQDMPFDVKR